MDFSNQNTMQLVLEALDASGNLVAVLLDTGETLRLQDGNAALFAGFKCAADDLIGLELGYWFAAPSGAQAIYRSLKQAGGRGSARGDILCRRPRGGEFWLGYHIMASPSMPGIYVLLGRDITQKRIEREQEELIQELLTMGFMATPSAISIINGEGRIIISNPPHDRMMGAEPGTLRGRFAKQFQTPETAAYFDAVRDSGQFHGDAELEHRVTFRRQDGAIFTARTTSRVIAHRDGKIFRMVVFKQEDGEEIIHPAIPVRLQTSGKLRLIKLDEVREELGGRWEAMRARVMETAETIIRRRIHQHEVMSRSNDSGFIVCFDDTEDEATLRAASIGREIRTKLIGKGENPDWVEILAVVAPLDGNGDNPAAVQAKLEQVEREAVASLKPGGNAAIRSRPVRSAANGKVAGYYFDYLPPAQLQAGRIALPPSRLDRDLGLLNAAAQYATANHAQDVLLFDIDFDLCQVRSKIELFRDTCRALPPAVTDRLVPVLTGLPPGTTQARLLDAYQRLQNGCRTLGIAVDDPSRPIGDLAVIPHLYMVLNARSWKNRSEAPHGAISRLSNQVRVCKGRLLVRSIGGMEEGKALHALGVDLCLIDDEAAVAIAGK